MNRVKLTGAFKDELTGSWGELVLDLDRPLFDHCTRQQIEEIFQEAVDRCFGPYGKFFHWRTSSDPVEVCPSNKRSRRWRPKPKSAPAK